MTDEPTWKPIARRYGVKTRQDLLMALREEGYKATGRYPTFKQASVTLNTMLKEGK